MTNQPTPLRPFPYPGLSPKLCWPSQVQLFLDAAATADCAPHNGYGLIGLLLQPAAYAALPGGPPPFTMEPHPGAIPAAANAFAAWKFSHELYSKDIAATAALRSLILSSMDQPSIDLVTDPTTGTRTRSLLDIITIWDDIYGVLTRADLEALNAARHEPFSPPASLRSFLTAQEQMIAVALANGYAVPQYDQVQDVLACLRPCAIYEPAIQRFYEDHPSVATQTWTNLKTRLVAFDDNRPSSATAASHGYANAAIMPALPTPPTPADLTTLIAAAVQTALQSSHGRRGPPAAPAVPAGFIADYCWTHGFTRVRTGRPTHSSASCNHPAAGHKVQATLSNRMGGRHS